MTAAISWRVSEDARYVTAAELVINLGRALTWKTMYAEPLVVITGAAGNLALACARRFRESRLLLTDANAARMDVAVNSLANDGIRVQSMVADITTSAGAQAIAKAASDSGPAGALIHAAGVAPPSPPELIMAVNLFGTANLLAAFEPLLHRAFTGVVLASLAAHRRLAAELDDLTLDPKGSPAELTARVMARYPTLSASRLAYAVSKRGTVLQVKKHALTWARVGARLVSISPGIIADTAMGMHRGAQAPSAGDAEIDIRYGMSTEIASAVWLAASLDASLVNGTDILVDGGYLASVDTAYPPSKRDDWHQLRI